MALRAVARVFCQLHAGSGPRGCTQAASGLRARRGATSLHYAPLAAHRLFASSEAELSTAKTLAQDKLRGFVVRMRGLPYSASATDGKSRPRVEGTGSAGARMPLGHACSSHAWCHGFM